MENPTNVLIERELTEAAKIHSSLAIAPQIGKLPATGAIAKMQLFWSRFMDIASGLNLSADHFSDPEIESRKKTLIDLSRQHRATAAQDWPSTTVESDE